MFGYIKPCTAELKVRENELYGAVYCGLCRAMGKMTGQVSRLTLSYDFVFFAAVRMLLTGECAETELRRCAAHPVKSRNTALYTPSFGYTAAVAAILGAEKLCDDINDESGVKRILSRLCVPTVKRGVKRAVSLSERGEYPELSGVASLSEKVRDGLEGLYALEAAGSDSLDACADAFGGILATLLSFGLDKKNGRIASELGRGTGRFIYIVDAVDDIGEDRRRGRFNPILNAYGELAVDGDGISRAVGEDINTAALLDLDRTAHAAELACDGANARDIASIVRNIIYLGMPDTIKKTINKDRKEGRDKR